MPEAPSGGECPDAVVVVNSDYQSTTVGSVDLDGEVVDDLLIASSSEQTGLSATLTGDVVLPSPSMTGSLVLIDRYPAAVLTWLDPHRAEARQLNVSTGFASNPHDYIPIDEDRAYITRFGENRDPGDTPFDRGSDVLIVDPTSLALTGRIDMTEALGDDYPEFLPTPDRGVRIGNVVYLTLTAQAADFSRRAASRIVSIDTTSDSVIAVSSLPGLESCGAIAASPSGTQLAVSCTGGFTEDDAEGGFPGSAIVLVNADADGVEIAREYPAAEFGEGQLGESLTFTDEQHLFAVSLGRFDSHGDMSQADALLHLDLEAGTVDVVYRSKREPFTLGTVACAPACGKCFATDADPVQPGLLVFDSSSGSEPTLTRRVQVDTCSGLPPRYLGFWSAAP